MCSPAPIPTPEAEVFQHSAAPTPTEIIEAGHSSGECRRGLAAVVVYWAGVTQV